MELIEIKFINVLILIAISHLILAILSTVELKLIPFYSFKVKVFWFLVIWILPVIGSFYFHIIARSGWKKIELN